jgi:transposase
VALAALKGEKTLTGLVHQFDVHPNQITDWKVRLSEGAAGLFDSDATRLEAAPTADLTGLHVKIGEVTLEKDFLISAPSKAGLAGRKTMIDREHEQLAVTLVRLAARRHACFISLQRTRSTVPT